MDRLTVVEGVAAVILESNINTDDIIPARWVLNPATDLGAKLFANRRYAADARETSDFVLNQAPYRHSVVLISGENFGCGSSREAAVWALAKFGFRVIVAASFGDIFYENCFQNGLLPVRLPLQQIAALQSALTESVIKKVTVDLVRKMISVGSRWSTTFELPEQRRNALLQGQDTLGQLLSWQDSVATFERVDQFRRPWLWSRD
jgi:3-isopropylmalate/(R)-2-methylmalate dehydratase small subunit